MEYGFIDNAKDQVKLQNDLLSYVEAVVKAVTEYLGFKYTPPFDSTTYTVKKGDSLYSIARQFGITVNELKSSNNLTGETLTVGQKLTIPQSDVSGDLYQVQKGDTLYSISRKLGVPVADLRRANSLNTDTLTPGQLLVIPSTEDNNDSTTTNTYIVARGDSLWTIANKNNTTVDELKKAITIPLFLLQNIGSLALSIEEFLFLMYLKDKGERFVFNPIEMEEDTGFDKMKVMQLISNLTDKKLITLETTKNDSGVLEEMLDLTPFYKKYLSLFIDSTVEKEDKEVPKTLFEEIEREFGRTLSPNELEFIKAWLDTFDKDVILEAVKEATLNGVSSIRYIDKILYEWDRKGIKKKEDVEHFLNLKKQEEKEPVEVFDYDWFDEDDE